MREPPKLVVVPATKDGVGVVVVTESDAATAPLGAVEEPEVQVEGLAPGKQSGPAAVCDDNREKYRLEPLTENGKPFLIYLREDDLTAVTNESRPTTWQPPEATPMRTFA